MTPNAKSLLPLGQLAALNLTGLGTRARRDALERAVTYRLDDGAYSVSCQGQDDEQGLMPDDEEYSVDPRCDHNGFLYANTGYEGQSCFFTTMVPE